MDRKILLRVVTPNRAVVREDVDEIQAPGRAGYLGILPGHAPLISELQPGEMSYRKGRDVRKLAVSGGFLEVLPEQVTVLAETAEWPEEIDIARAQAARDRAEKRLKSSDPECDINRATVALQRALSRLQVAGLR
jgi:F-type H+-transporting ATPase subunit epsilon